MASVCSWPCFVAHTELTTRFVCCKCWIGTIAVIDFSAVDTISRVTRLASASIVAWASHGACCRCMAATICGLAVVDSQATLSAFPKAGITRVARTTVLTRASRRAFRVRTAASVCLLAVVNGLARLMLLVITSYVSVAFATYATMLVGSNVQTVSIGITVTAVRFTWVDRDALLARALEMLIADALMHSRAGVVAHCVGMATSK